MLDFGWAEFALIGLVLLLVIGPKDIPNLMYQAGKIFRRLHYMKFALSQQFDNFMEKAEASSNRAATQKADESDTSRKAPDETPETPEPPLEMDETNPFFVKGDDEADMDGDIEQQEKPSTAPKETKKS